MKKKLLNNVWGAIGQTGKMLNVFQMFGGVEAGMSQKKKKRQEKIQGISDELSNSDAHLKQNDVLKKILNKIFAHNINEIEVFIILAKFSNDNNNKFF